MFHNMWCQNIRKLINLVDTFGKYWPNKETLLM